MKSSLDPHKYAELVAAGVIVMTTLTRTNGKMTRRDWQKTIGLQGLHETDCDWFRTVGQQVLDDVISIGKRYPGRIGTSFDASRIIDNPVTPAPAPLPPDTAAWMNVQH